MELDQRTKRPARLLPPKPVPPAVQERYNPEIKRFAENGGPDLSDIIGVSCVKCYGDLH
jgi:hypothetical protein